MTNKHKSIEEILEELYVSIESYTRLNGLKAEDSDAIEQVLAEHRTTLQSYAQQQVQEAVEEIEGLMEKLADIEHQRWAKWQDYLHSKMVEHSDGKGEWVCLPSELFKRWERQIATPYSGLSEQEKESDREQVRPYLSLILSILKSKTEDKK
jgi:hypothetical protein